MRPTLALGRLLVGIFLFVAVPAGRSPVFAEWHGGALAVLIVGSIGLLLVEWRCAWRPDRFEVAMRVGTASLAVAALCFTLAIEVRFQRDRMSVLHADASALERLGRHVVVGYRDPDALRLLVERKAVAGVFVTARNVQGLTTAEIRRTIAGLQALRAAQGLPPLWIAADQEGGVVSRLSPPLPRRPPLASLASGGSGDSDFAGAEHYGVAQGRELADLGVNLNFAPVVDLNRFIVNPHDRHTRIYQRAISADPAVVTEVARRYCQGLSRSGVRCTLKHFPGLGRVAADTHLGAAELSAPLAELAAADWIPFRALMRDDAFAMLAHVHLGAVDPEHPASLSRAVVSNLLRDAWRYDGILITDDVSMGAIAGSREGVAGAGVAALAAGVDLVLVAYDPDQFFPLMAGLLRAERDGRLSPDMLATSAVRLRRSAPARP